MMKEFALNADFGMTATDDGFKLYGISAGDVITFQQCKDFPVDGSLVVVSIDNGPATLKRLAYYDAHDALILEGGSGKVATVIIDSASSTRLKILGVAVSVIHSLAPVTA